MNEFDYQVDSTRATDQYADATGIYVRARHDEKWGSYDIAQLTPGSLLRWLRSRGEKNEFAENVVGILLGHGNIVATETPVKA